MLFNETNALYGATGILQEILSVLSFIPKGG